MADSGAYAYLLRFLSRNDDHVTLTCKNLHVDDMHRDILKLKNSAHHGKGLAIADGGMDRVAGGGDIANHAQIVALFQGLEHMWQVIKVRS